MLSRVTLAIRCRGDINMFEFLFCLVFGIVLGIVALLTCFIAYETRDSDLYLLACVPGVLSACMLKYVFEWLS